EVLDPGPVEAAVHPDVLAAEAEGAEIRSRPQRLDVRPELLDVHAVDGLLDDGFGHGTLPTCGRGERIARHAFAERPPRQPSTRRDEGSVGAWRLVEEVADRLLAAVLVPVGDPEVDAVAHDLRRHGR